MCVTNQHAALKSLSILHVTERKFENEVPTIHIVKCNIVKIKTVSAIKTNSN